MRRWWWSARGPSASDDMPGSSEPRSGASGRRVIGWLLEDDQPSVRYYTLVDLLGRREDDPEVRRTRSRIPRVGWAARLLRRQKPKGYWEPREPTDFRSWARFLQFPQFGSTMWPALVLADLGLTSRDPRIRRTAELFFDYKLRLSSPFNFFTEEVCAVGNLARMLVRFGYREDRRVQKLFEWMIEDQRANGGWNCAPDRPGTLDCWEALAAFSEVPRASRPRKMESAVERGVEFYLERALFREGKRYDPWLRFHYPTHYFYDVLVGLDVVTRLGYSDDRRLRPALRLLEKKRWPDGTWAADAVHPDVGTELRKDYEGKEFKPWSLEPAGGSSKWITLCALRVQRRVDAVS